MSERRMRRRLLGWLGKHIPELELDEVADPRKARGRRWRLGTLLRTVVVAMVCGARSLRETESQTAQWSPQQRGPLGLGRRRVPDTTLRDLVCAMTPQALRPVLYRIVRAAHRRKALEPEQLPFGVCAIDGKSTAIDVADARYAQKQSHSNGTGEYGLVRTLTACLTSSRAAVCLDAAPIPAWTNEMGHFEVALGQLCRAYKGLNLFSLITADAGMCSEHNAQKVLDHGLHYLFALKLTQPTIFAEAQRWLGSQTEPLAITEDVVGPHTVRRQLFLTEQMSGWEWKHLRTTLRVVCEKTDRRTGQLVEMVDARTGGLTTQIERYFISSLPAAKLTAKQWLRVVREHWGVENSCHFNWDVMFQEDARPWVRASGKGALVAMMLRRIAYNLVTLFRSVTQRSEEKHHVPWMDLIRAFYRALMIGEQQLVPADALILVISP